MTREEAIKFLTLMRKAVSNFEEYGHDKASMVIECDKAEAFDMAIEALSEVRCNDCKWNDDVIEVVRCKDCRYYWGNLSEDDTDEMYGECRWNSDEMPNDDDFCSYGERAEQTDNKLPGYDEIMDRLDNPKLEFTIHGTERIRRIKEDDND